jgi:hypothetical protein
MEQYLIVKRYTFDQSQSAYKFREIEDALSFWEDSVKDWETYGGVAIAFYKNGLLFDFR